MFVSQMSPVPAQEHAPAAITRVSLVRKIAWEACLSCLKQTVMP
jgi:hypothetical protein